MTETDGAIKTAMTTFRGKGGSGAIDGFMFALTLVPPIMLSVAMVNIFEYYGAIKAAGRLLTPILRPLMGLPGYTALSLIASTQSTDAGAALTRTLKDEGRLTEREVLIFATFQMTAGAAIGNFLSSGVVIFTLTDAAGKLCVPTTIGACLGVILLGKLLSANSDAPSAHPQAELIRFLMLPSQLRWEGILRTVILILIAALFGQRWAASIGPHQFRAAS